MAEIIPLHHTIPFAPACGRQVSAPAFRRQALPAVAGLCENNPLLTFLR